MPDSGKMRCVAEGKYEVMKNLVDAAVAWKSDPYQDTNDTLVDAIIAYENDDSKLVPERGKPGPIYLSEDEIDDLAEND